MSKSISQIEATTGKPYNEGPKGSFREPALYKIGDEARVKTDSEYVEWVGVRVKIIGVRYNNLYKKYVYRTETLSFGNFDAIKEIFKDKDLERLK